MRALDASGGPALAPPMHTARGPPFAEGRVGLLGCTEGEVLDQPAVDVPGGAVVDSTGAGDAYRAAFAVALVEGQPLQRCMAFAAAAGSLAPAASTPRAHS